MSNRIEVQHYFDAAHQLQDSDFLITKACARLHGHTYAVKINLQTIEGLNPAGMVIDFRAIKDIVDRFDHQFINAVLGEANIELQPTAENIAYILHTWLSELPNIKVNSVAVCEGYKGAEKACWAVYEA